MRILVISDTHRFTTNAERLINEYNPDYVLHLGDVCDDCEKLTKLFPDKIILSVIGNNDYECRYPDYPRERFFPLDGKKIFMCHGHRYNVKGSLVSLAMRGRELGADIVLFGHTHERLLQKDGDMLIMNPGTVFSYGLIDIENGKIDARIEKI